MSPPRDAELVDLERVDRLERVLPPLVLHRGRIVDLRPGLAQVQGHDRVLDEDVADHPTRQEGAPVDARVEALDARHRGVGLLILDDHGVAEVQGEVDRAPVQRADRDRVAGEARVHLGLGVATQRLVHEEQGHHRGHQQQHRECAHHEEPAARGHASPPIGPAHAQDGKQGLCPPRSGAACQAGGARRVDLSGPTREVLTSARRTGRLSDAARALSRRAAGRERWHRS